jgi:hypothetical protein
MLLKEINAVYSENDTEPISTLCGQNSGPLHAKAGGTYSQQCASEGQTLTHIGLTSSPLPPHPLNTRAWITFMIIL